ncbi:MAG: hypothetical protein GX802_06235 [Clostridiales bacterium]|nr:hypothetical protein [Clostridiales bacterium]
MGYGYGTVEYCSTEWGTIRSNNTAGQYVGGFIGHSLGTTIKNSYVRVLTQFQPKANSAGCSGIGTYKR